MNRVGSAVEMMRALKENSVTLEAAAQMSEEELRSKIVRGILVDRELPEYTAEYEKIIARAQVEAGLQSAPGG
jgi:2-oxoglutarate ferredoxin oxidoreductase subunit beta